MVDHVHLCLEEIEAEIAATDFSVIGARSRELIAQHIAGIRYIVEAAAAGTQRDREAATRIAAAVSVESSAPRLSTAA
jgi:hypothetical protein